MATRRDLEAHPALQECITGSVHRERPPPAQGGRSCLPLHAGLERNRAGHTAADARFFSNGLRDSCSTRGSSCRSTAEEHIRSLRTVVPYALMPLSVQSLPNEKAMTQRVPIIEEQAEIRTHEIETGRVRISKSVVAREEEVDLSLQKEEVEISRVRVDRAVAAPVPTRQEGDVTIVSLHEEVTVLTRQLVVTEELHIRRKRSEFHEPRQVTLRREELSVERGAPLMSPAQHGANGADAIQPSGQ
ncbi:MAG: hypothetical protein AVDCRST_MAG71-447 [uncultured Lysobacter sp.]|uniref:DUF2382 domain-containing protein n=1 Tax=uncultured Lysobacter sp. TaxID=271060 RepID=A0A6J4KKM2_9GAMM|nr:MAG: hypothetical protein AVDCRST_MAG71-447 [uncultured Lysobacter sp.]